MRSDARKRLAEQHATRTLPAPDCPRGYTTRQLDQIIGDQMPGFRRWMTGQSVGVCDGQRFNHDTRDYEPTDCADQPHGIVTYECDIQRFLNGAA